MTFIRFVVIAGLAGMALAPAVLAQQAAPNEPPCAEHTHVAGKLRETFGERMIGSGLAESGVLFELYVGPSGTWTLIATTPGGVSCLIGAGDPWEPRPAPDMFVAR